MKRYQEKHIKSKKNRDAILKIIRKWKNLINKNPSS